MSGSTLSERAQRKACLGYAIGQLGALLLGLFLFLQGFASGWGRDSIGAGIVIGIFAPAAFLGVTAILTLLSSCVVLPESKSKFFGMLVFAPVGALLVLFFYYSCFIPFVHEFTDSSRAWQGHRLPHWWTSASIWIGTVSLVFIASSVGLSIGSLMSRRQKESHEHKPAHGST